MKRWSVLVLSVSLVWVGCGGEDHPNSIDIPEGGDSGISGASGAETAGEAGNSGSAGEAGEAAGSSGTTNGGGAGQAGSTNSAGQAGSSEGGGAGQAGQAGASGQTSTSAPRVTITSPTPSASPDDGNVLTGASVEVVCEARSANAPNAVGVDPSSVVIEMLGSDDAVLQTFAGEPSEVGEYRATFQTSQVPTGSLSFRCAASDLADPPASGVDVISTYVDHGPKVTVASPEPDDTLPLHAAVGFEFTVEPDPITADDLGAAVDLVSLSVEGVDVPLEASSTDDNTYLANVDLTDREIFPDLVNNSVAVLITATNSRSPEPVTRELDYNFTVDGEGPDIKLVSPSDGAIIGGEVTLHLTVTDSQSDVDPSSLTIELNDVPYTFDPEGRWTQVGDDFTFTFDSSKVSGSKVQVTVNVSAKDTLGNLSKGLSPTYYLDNQPPSIDLDPENVREVPPSPDRKQCSNSFDPLGLADDDLSVIEPATLLRALVWDNTNSVEGQTVFYHSKTNQNSVYLYVQPEPSVPLLIDRSGDGYCDDLDTTDLTFRQLTAVPPQGTSPSLGEDASVFPEVPLAPEGSGPGCTFGGATSSPPTPLCGLPVTDPGEISRVVQHVMSGVEPVVYGIGPLDGLECAGRRWEISTVLPGEGWICVAVRGLDNVGNVGISRPLRLCYDDPNTSDVPDCVSSTDPPSCTDGCEPPPRFPGGLLRP